MVNIESELAPLKKVLIHTPGPEVECVSPENADKFLFHGILFLKDVLKDYSIFKSVLSTVAKTYEVKQCLQDVIENPHAREACLDQILSFYDAQHFKSSLLALDSKTLASSLIEGLPYENRSQNTILSPEDHYLLQPLPNLYFTRDACSVVGQHVVSGTMANSVRSAESILIRTIFEHHPDFANAGFLLNEFNPKNNDGLTLEGGDLHIWSKDLYLVGFSERTNWKAIDAFISALSRKRKQDSDDAPFHVLIVDLPKNTRAPKLGSMIHLDMIFTRVNENQALAYAPALFGPQSFRTTRITIQNYEKTHHEDKNNLLDALKSVGTSIEPILCGGAQSLLRQQREQWVSGCNSVALAPGKIISYENEHTLRALEQGGFTVVPGKDFVKNFELYQKTDNIVVTINGSQLSQGGGGPRCMTCPIERGRF